MTDTPDRPFDKNYVISLTLKHMRGTADYSINKTIARVAEFSGDSVKSMEIMQTLSILHDMKRDIDKLSESIVNKSGSENDNS